MVAANLVKKFAYSDTNGNTLTLCINLGTGRVWLHNQHNYTESLYNIGFMCPVHAQGVREVADFVYNAAMEAAYAPNAQAAVAILRNYLNLNFAVVQF